MSTTVIHSNNNVESHSNSKLLSSPIITSKTSAIIEDTDNSNTVVVTPPPLIESLNDRLENHSDLDDESLDENEDNRDSLRNKKKQFNNTLISDKEIESINILNNSISTIIPSKPISNITSITISSSSNNSNNSNNKNNNSSNENNNLFVNFLPSSFTSEVLKSMFINFGEIDSCRVMVDLISGQSKGYGFVKFKNQTSAQAAINAMNGAKYQNKTLLVRYANSDPSQPAASTAIEEGEASKASSNVYIKGLPLDCTQDQLIDIFSKYGQVLETKLLLDISTNSSRGQALVRFKDVDSATKACETLNGYQFPSSETVLVVRYAKNEDEKSQSNQKKIQMRQQLQQNQQLQQQHLRFSPYPSPNSSPSPILTNIYPYSHHYPIPTLPSIHSPILSPSVGILHPHHQHQQQHQQQQHQQQQQQYQDPTNLYINNLPTTADDNLLYKLFSPSGAIASVKIVRDQSNGLCKGYGFVRMLNLTDSYQAINQLNGIILEGKKIQVSFKK
ncbi:RNA-binding region RNP-1 domain-containing protein [Tieghemostelium lacteum]|uniref:RNA-binding region RNP-1 domain-containing protein n=1 Tax=Tieghemostelium lacteum TaxID=361077 RepID=A0A152A4K2_TIELA|nr:RNA-binding region RNP-1 domain-containing protein [Tieghemostelium lacteum]|eukprot:KYR00981.1 RNA-binding region RNP-1 domain-containing protein [Tieghemostelium lacteum]